MVGACFMQEQTSMVLLEAQTCLLGMREQTLLVAVTH